MRDRPIFRPPPAPSIPLPQNPLRPHSIPLASASHSAAVWSVALNDLRLMRTLCHHERSAAVRVRERHKKGARSDRQRPQCVSCVHEESAPLLHPLPMRAQTATDPVGCDSASRSASVEGTRILSEEKAEAREKEEPDQKQPPPHGTGRSPLPAGRIAAGSLVRGQLGNAPPSPSGPLPSARAARVCDGEGGRVCVLPVCSLRCIDTAAYSLHRCHGLRGRSGSHRTGNLGFSDSCLGSLGSPPPLSPLFPPLFPLSSLSLSAGASACPALPLPLPSAPLLSPTSPRPLAASSGTAGMCSRGEERRGELEGRHGKDNGQTRRTGAHGDGGDRGRGRQLCFHSACVRRCRESTAQPPSLQSQSSG
jgi:hypothetical protein